MRQGIQASAARRLATSLPGQNFPPAQLLSLESVPANVLKIDHVLCDHHERVIRRAVRRSENKNPSSAGEQLGPPIAEAKCIVPTLRDIKPEADCKREPVGSKQAELFLKHDLVMFYKRHQRRNPERGGKNALWSTLLKSSTMKDS